MNEMLEKFDSASEGQLLEKEQLSGPEQSPSPERFEVKDSGSGMGVEGAPESSSPETRPDPALDEVPLSMGASNGGELLAADTFQGGERALASPLGFCAPTDHDVVLPEVGTNAATCDDEKSAARSDFRGGSEPPDVASQDVTTHGVASSNDGCEQLPVVVSDVSGPARDVGVVSLDTGTSDDECDDPPVLALLPRQGCTNGVASSDESGDASDASPKPSGRDFADEAASSDDERQSARVAVDGNEKADTDSTPKGPKDQKVQRKSAQRAASELQQIYSTSQRMVRENKMALPYHEPAKLSLKAFLDQRRSKPSPEQPQQPAQSHVEEQALPLQGQPRRRMQIETPGSGRLMEPSYWNIHRFLGSLPANYGSLVQETSRFKPVTSGAFEQLSGMHETANSWDEQSGRGDRPDNSSMSEDRPRGENDGEGTSGSHGGTSASGRGEEPVCKRRKMLDADLIGSILAEQRLLRLSFEEARQKEFALRERSLDLQERVLQTQRDLTAAVLALLNKP